MGAKDAKKVIEKLKRSGTLPQIKLPERKPVGSGFKRKVPERISGSLTADTSNKPSPSDNPAERSPVRLFKPPSRAPNLISTQKMNDGKVEQKWSAIAGRKDNGPTPDIDLKRELVSYDDDIF